MKSLYRARNTLRVGVLLSCFALAACTKDKPEFSKSGSAANSAPAVTSMISVDTNTADDTPAATEAQTRDANGKPLSITNRASITIQKSALGKEFFLDSHLVTQAPEVVNKAQKTRIVKFNRVDDAVFMVESPTERVTTTYTTPTLILARIPIASETETSLVLDFNAGMNQIFTLNAWYEPDEPASTGTTRPSLTELHYTARNIRSSYIASATFVENSLYVRQTVQTENDALRVPLEVRYFLEPYSDNPGFEVYNRAQDFRHFSFVETPSSIESVTGRTNAVIAHWDIRRPIVWHMSANTPEHLRSVITEGVLYWNKAFGREVMQVRMAPEGINAPYPGMNIIQWVDNHETAWAYADPYINPRTGEIRGAQVFLRTGPHLNYYRIHYDLARRLTPETERVAAGSNGHACSFDMSSPYAAVGQEMLDIIRRYPEQVRKIGMDDWRFLVAHEVGHTLGLRHNFAGSKGSSYTPQERYNHFMHYLETGEPPAEGVITNSVMDYHWLFETAMGGARMVQTESEAFPYDRAAIAKLYKLNPEGTPEVRLPHCSDYGAYEDSQPTRELDCKRGDFGADPIAADAWNVQYRLHQMPKLLVTQLIQHIYPLNPRDRGELSEFSVSPDSFISLGNNILAHTVRWYQTTIPSSVHTKLRLPRQMQLLATPVAESMNAWIEKQTNDAGGIENVLFATLPSEAQPEHSLAANWHSTLNQYLSEGWTTNFSASDGETRSLSESEINLVKQIADQVFPVAEETFWMTQLTSIGSGTYRNFGPIEEIEDTLIKVARQFLLKHTPSTEAGTLPSFRYSQPLRLKAAALLRDSLSENPGWSADAKSVIRTELTALVESTLGTALGNTNPHALPQPKRQWFTQQKAVLEALR